MNAVTIRFRAQTGKLNLRGETTWQRERKLITIPWYTEVYFERAYTYVKDKTIFGSTVSFILSQANKRHDL